MIKIFDQDLEHFSKTNYEVFYRYLINHFNQVLDAISWIKSDWTENGSKCINVQCACGGIIGTPYRVVQSMPDKYSHRVKQTKRTA